jgi:hypothetical protein
MKRIVLAVLLSLTSTLIQVPVNAATVGCPDTWNFKPTTEEITVLNASSRPEDFLTKYGVSFESFKEATEIGQQFLFIPSSFSYLPAPYYLKIQEGGRDIAISGERKTSLDGKNWIGLSNFNGDLLPGTGAGNSQAFLSPPSEFMGRGRLWPIALASRLGLTPGTQLALEVKVNVNGCKEKIFYERKAVIPSYEVKTRNLDDLLDLYYKVYPAEQQLNFLNQKIFNNSLNTFIDHLKNISGRNSVWTISNTRRGVLDIYWTLTGESLDVTPFIPFGDLSVSPTKGDGCFTLTTPYKSVYTYRTLKYPCSVSINLSSYKELVGTFEVARFEITGPKAKPVTITCIKGKVSKKVTTVSPKCPTGYKKK